MTKRSGKKFDGREPSLRQPTNRSNGSYRAKKRALKRSMRRKARRERDVDPTSMVDPTSRPAQEVTGSHVGVTVSSTRTLPSSSGRNTREQKRMRNKEKGDKGRFFGFIFMCNGRTKPECYRHCVFGLPEGMFDVVKKIDRETKLFLFDTDLKLLYGVYKATTKGKLRLEPYAFNGRFPAQVRFKVSEDCLPIPESAFRHAIKDNYHGPRFSQELSRNQVRSLISLFQPVNFPTASAGRNVAAPSPSRNPPLEEDLRRPRRHPLPVDSYMSEVQYQHSRSRQVLPHSPYDPFASEKNEANLQLFREPPQMIAQAGFPRHGDPYYPETHEEYVPEKPSLSAQDLYARYGVVPDDIPRDRYEPQYRAQQVSNERDMVSHSEYLAANSSQHLSRIPAHSYALMPSHPQNDLRFAYQSFYGAAGHGGINQVYAAPLQRAVPGNSNLLENNLPASSRFTYR